MTAKIDWLTLVSETKVKLYDNNGLLLSPSEMRHGDFHQYLLSSPEMRDFGETWSADKRSKHSVCTFVSDRLVKASLLVTGNVMLTLSGEACACYDDLVNHIILPLKDKWHITRIDLAVDFPSPPFSAADVWAEAGKYSGSGRPRQTQLIIDAFGLATAYFGVRTSDIFVRVYDKMIAKEKNLRFETEIKYSVARSLLTSLVSADQFIDRLDYLVMRGDRLVNSGILSGAINSAKVCSSFLQNVPANDETRIKWFDEQVIPAFVKLAITRPDVARSIANRLTNIAFMSD